MHDVIVLGAVVALAFAVETALGFGATVIAIALGSLVLPIAEVTGPFLCLNLALSGWIAFQGRRSIRWRVLLTRVFPLAVLGMPAGAAFGALVDPEILRRVFGATVVVLALLELIRLGQREPPRSSLLVTNAALIGGGVVHGAFATGGPAIVWALGRELGEDKAALRSTLAVVWLVLNAAFLVIWAFRGLVTDTTVLEAAPLGLALLAGTIVGEIVFRRIAPARFRAAVFVVLLVAGVVLIAT